MGPQGDLWGRGVSTWPWGDLWGHGVIYGTVVFLRGPEAPMGPGADLWGRGLFPYRSLDALSSRGRGGGAGNAALPIAAVILSLRDLIGYFRAPHTELQHEQRQSRLRSLRRRQDLFQQEVPPHSACGAGMGLWGGYGAVGRLWGRRDGYMGLRSLRRCQDLFQQEVPPHSACGAVMGP